MFVPFESIEEISVVPYSISNVEIDIVERAFPFPRFFIGRSDILAGGRHDLHQTTCSHFTDSFCICPRFSYDKPQRPKDVYILSQGLLVGSLGYLQRFLWLDPCLVDQDSGQALLELQDESLVA